MTFDRVTTAEFWDQFARTAWSHLSGVNGVMILIFWGIVVFAIAFSYLMTPQPRSLRGLFGHVLPREVIRHPSARADLLFWLSRRIFMPLFVLPLAVSTVAAGHVAYRLLGYAFGYPTHPPGAAGPVTLVAFTITMFVAYDISYYLYHRLQHRVPFMWELHKVHHSAEVMVGVTKDRVHPFDELMNRWWDGIIPGLAYGAWLYFALDPVELTVFGLNVYFLRNTVLMMDFVRHTHLKVTYGRWLNQIFLCPHYHQLHHSVARHHWHRNFGLAFAFWDRLFGTLVEPEPAEDFRFGLPDQEAEEYQSLARLHFVPMKRIALLAGRWIADRGRLRDGRQLLRTSDR